MNALEAIEFMKNGGVVDCCVLGTEFLYKIENNVLKYSNKNTDGEFKEAKYFPFDKDFEEYIGPKRLTGWERVKRGKRYFVVGERADVYSLGEWGDSSDSEVFENSNYFSTEQKAEEINFKQTLFRKLQRFSDEHGGLDIDWNNEEQEKFFLRYNSRLKEIYIDRCCRIIDFGQVYFISKEAADFALKMYKEDLTKYFTHDWSK